MLLILGLFVTLLAIAALASAPRVAQQIQRDREEEMIHRGAQYARAIKKFVKKTGRYPTSLEQLENTNNVRFLRQRYKDPMTQDGEWRLLHVGDVQLAAAPQVGQVAGQAAGGPGGAQNPQQSIFQQSPQPGSPGGLTGIGAMSSPGLAGGAGGLVGGSGPGGLTGTIGPGATGVGGQGTASGPGGLSPQQRSGQDGQAGQVFGAGAIIGVASSSDKEGIKEFAEKKKYKEWYFVYDPALERATPNGGGLITGPYTGKTFGVGSSGIGTPAGQLASPDAQPRGFGQPIGQPMGSSPGGLQPTQSNPPRN